MLSQEDAQATRTKWALCISGPADLILDTILVVLKLDDEKCMGDKTIIDCKSLQVFKFDMPKGARDFSLNQILWAVISRTAELRGYHTIIKDFEGPRDSRLGTKSHRCMVSPKS